MADTTFTNGTVVQPDWLNDVNDLTYSATTTGKAVLSAPDAAGARTAIGISSFGGDLIDSVNSTEAKTTLGISSFGSSLIASPDAESAYGVLGRTGVNRVINGDFSIDQRLLGSTTSLQGYTVDRWKIKTTSGTFTVGQVTPVLGDTRLRITATSDIVGLQISQSIEALNIADLANSVVTLSFDVVSPTVTNIAAGAIYPLAQNDFSLTSDIVTSALTISSTKTRKSISFTLPAEAINGVGICPLKNTVMPAGSYIEITNVQLEKGSTATPYNKQLFFTELTNCRRYYERIGYAIAVPLGIGLVYSATEARCIIHYSPKRVFPVGAIAAPTTGWQLIWPTAQTASNASFAETGYTSANIVFTSSGMTVGNAVQVRAMGTASQISLDAEYLL